VEPEPAGTVTFCLSGNATGTAIHYGGTGSGSGNGCGSGSKIKWSIKIERIKNEMPTFWEIMLLLTLKRQDFVQLL
jgi:hypothetical protein